MSGLSRGATPRLHQLRESASIGPWSHSPAAARLTRPYLRSLFGCAFAKQELAAHSRRTYRQFSTGLSLPDFLPLKRGIAALSTSCRQIGGSTIGAVLRMNSKGDPPERIAGRLEWTLAVPSLWLSNLRILHLPQLGPCRRLRIPRPKTLLRKRESLGSAGCTSTFAASRSAVVPSSCLLRCNSTLAHRALRGPSPSALPLRR